MNKNNAKSFLNRKFVLACYAKFSYLEIDFTISHCFKKKGIEPMKSIAKYLTS
jgi:hypothetical protein